jgi:ankyrin repeat/BTB/POZ domain-containing protein 2
MEFLYHGGCATLDVNQSDVLELMAAANFFQLDGLLRFCEAQCSTTIDLDNIVSMYIHAKVIRVCVQDSSNYSIHLKASD